MAVRPRGWATATTLAAAVLVAASPPARADVAAPFIVVNFPAGWAVMALVFLVEAALAIRMLLVRPLRAAGTAAAANLATGLAGIPLAGPAVGFLRDAAGEGPMFRPEREGFLDFARGLDFQIWFGRRDRAFTLLLAAALLCLVLFLLSALVEWFVARLLRPREGPPDLETRIRAWAWTANAVSYGGFLLWILGAWLLRSRA